MARKSLRPYLNQIRTWTRQGRTDAWVAHQLEVTVQQIASFKRESGLLDEEPGVAGASPIDIDEEIDLRAEDDALIAAGARGRRAGAARGRGGGGRRGARATGGGGGEAGRR